jgi:DNA polymerase delta subunit 1
MLLQKLSVIAKLYDVSHKIDFDAEDEGYFSKWYSVLTKYGELKAKFSGGQRASKITLKTVGDVRKFNNNAALLEKLKLELHEDYDYESSDLVKTLVATTPVEEDPPAANDYLRSTFVSERVTLKAHIIDVDYEYIDGLKIALYTRTVGSSETNLILCPFNDYFYIEVTEKYTVGKIRQAIKGQEWFLREKRYPETSYPHHIQYYDGRRHVNNIDTTAPLVVSTEVVDDHRSMYGFRPHNQQFVKVVTKYPTVTNHMFKSLSKKFPDMLFYEAGTDVINKFLTTHKLSGCVAVDVTGDTINNIYSTCDRAVVASSVALDPEAPFYEPRVMYYDIECLSLDINVFPSADTCPVIQISYLFMDGSKEVGQGVLCFKDTPGYDSYATEEQMLIRFAQLILEFNPDAITGFNSNNFDMPYIIDRMHVLGIYEFASQFSRRLGFHMSYRRTKKQSKQFGTKEVVSYVVPGRIMMDQFEIIKGDPTKRLLSYSLKNICAEYLGDDNKEDLKYKEIPSLFKSPEGRARIASYCLQDTLLLRKLDEKVMLGITTWGMTKVLGVTPDVTLNRGLVYKLMSKLKQYTEAHKLLIPTFTQEQKPKFAGKYQGAFVLDPDIGYYDDPVTVLDFASLYPALMIGWNLSYDTILFKNNEAHRKWMEENPDGWEDCAGQPFVKHKTKKGIVPMLEEEMARQRKAAKAKMAMAVEKKEAALEAGDQQGYLEWSIAESIYDSEQLANKIIMNSLYGMLGSPDASVPCVEIAKTITGLGRENLLAAKNFVEKNYCEITGEPEERRAKVIYGDTDSIFILMPGVDVLTAIRHGKKLDKEVQMQIFSHRKPMQMEYEKVYCPFIITRRKGYCGAKYEFAKKGEEDNFDPNKFKVSAMGFQIVRRDSAKLCRETMKAYFDYIFKDKKKVEGLRSVEVILGELFGRELELEDFIITKKIAKTMDQYKVVPPHVVAWQRMVNRVGKAEAPSVGERFEYIVTKMHRNKKMRRTLKECIMDVDLAREIGWDDIQVDYDYYFKVFIEKPLIKIMELIHGREETRKVLDPRRYERVEKVVATKNNILGYFGKKSLTTRKRQFGAGLDKAFVEEVKKRRKMDNQKDDGWEAGWFDSDEEEEEEEEEEH